MIHIDSSCSNNWSASVSLRKATCRTCGTALSRAGGGLFLSARTPKESDQFQVSHSSRRKSTPQTTSCRKSPPRPPRKRIERSHQILGEQMSKRIASSVAVCLPLAGNIWTHTPPKPRSGRGIFFATALHNPSFRWIPGEPITGGYQLTCTCSSRARFAKLIMDRGPRFGRPGRPSGGTLGATTPVLRAGVSRLESATQGATSSANGTKSARLHHIRRGFVWMVSL